jgi:FkbM family methyltransferase
MTDELFVPLPKRFVTHEATSLLFRLACYWNNRMPRGKGSVPRFLGKLIPKNVLHKLRTARGAEIFFTSDSLDMGAHFFNTGGYWNESVIRACIAAVGSRKDAVLYDIGANLGVVSIEVSTALSGDMRCFSFEPQKHLAEALALSADVNRYSGIKVINGAAGQSTGTLDLFTAASSIHVSHVARSGDGQAFRVTCYSLDDLVGKGMLAPPTVMKIDVEGGEFDVFRGARATISKYSPTIVFESDDNMVRWGYGREEILSFLLGCAPYKFYVLLPDGTARFHGSADANRPFDIVASLDDDFQARYRVV